MMSGRTGALASAPRRPLASVARTDYSLRCGAEPRSPCPIATGVKMFFWADARPPTKMALLYVCESGKKSLNPVDKHVGGRVRMRRLMLAMSQEKLGDALGLTFQQVQKYEKGTNRIGASRLHQISHILQVPVAFFFEGAPNLHGSTDRMKEAPSLSYVSDFLATPEGLLLTSLANICQRRRGV